MQDFPYSRHSSYEELCELVNSFRPLDVYPCTVDEENWSPEDGVENLFGHSCSGTTFAHDRKMELLATRRPSSQLETDDDTVQSLTSSRAASVESHLSYDMEKAFGAVKRPFPDHDHSHQSLSEQDLHAKRQRHSLPSACRDQESAGISREWFDKMKMSFREPPSRKQGKSTWSIKNGHNSRNVADRFKGTQMEPIELPDVTPPSSGDEAGDFLLDEIPEPISASEPAQASPSGPETQISISDAAFESACETQSPLRTLPEEARLDRVQRRKRAYKAAKDINGCWETDHALISSFDGHGEEEIEL